MCNEPNQHSRWLNAKQQSSHQFYEDHNNMSPGWKKHSSQNAASHLVIPSEGSVFIFIHHGSERICNLFTPYSLLLCIRQGLQNIQPSHFIRFHWDVQRQTKIAVWKCRPRRRSFGSDKNSSNKINLFCLLSASYIGKTIPDPARWDCRSRRQYATKYGFIIATLERRTNCEQG